MTPSPMSDRVTLNLDDVRRLTRIISLRRWCGDAGMAPQMMYARLHRGSPELSADESSRMVQALRGHGLEVTG